jgi:hypothetical protein
MCGDHLRYGYMDIGEGIATSVFPSPLLYVLFSFSIVPVL